MDLEKLYFRRSLTSPRNWFGNACSFLNYAGRALSSHLYNKLKPAHLSMKTRPPWLLPEMVSPTSLEAASHELESIETLEPSGIYGEQNNLARLPQSSIPDDDPERYLHFHRWGWLSWGYLNSSATQEEAFDWVDNWIVQNKNHSDPAWEPYSCCERIANIFVLLMQLPSELRKRILSGTVGFFILDSAHWIINHLEYYGPHYTNNHILNNGRALAIVGALTGNRKVLEVALSIFKNMLPVLVTERGFLKERSSHYQLVVFRWILDAERAISINKKFLAPDDIDFIRHYVNIMAKASVSMCDSKGMLKILIGDVSPDAKPEETCGFLNSLYPEWEVSGSTERSCDAGDGWFFLRQGGLEIITNQPEGYPLNFPNHGHADAVGFVFLFDGRQVLTDPGRNSYTKELLAKRFIGGLFHNVPLVNGLAPVATPFFSNWIPERYGSAQINASLSDMNSLKIEHDGFSRLGTQIWHTRNLSISDGKLIVLDEFDGKEVYEVTLCWHFAPGFNVESEDAGCIRLSSPFCSVTMITSVPKEGRPDSLKVSFHKASNDGGWYSPCYGAVQPTLTMHIHSNFRFPAVISTIFEVESCAE